MLIRDMQVHIAEWDPTHTDADKIVDIGIKLSKSPDLDPGLILDVAKAISSGDATAGYQVALSQQNMDYWKGTIWAPRYVGLRPAVNGFTAFRCFLHLDYERVFLPWRDWFVHWEFLDNINDNERDY